MTFVVKDQLFRHVHSLRRQCEGKTEDKRALNDSEPARFLRAGSDYIGLFTYLRDFAGSVCIRTEYIFARFHFSFLSVNYDY